MTFNFKQFNIVIKHFVLPFLKHIYCWGSKNSIFKASFAQVRPPQAKMAEKCEKALITIIVIDMLLIEGLESFQVIAKVIQSCS